MRPTLDSIRALCAEVDETLLEEHLSRLSDRYFESFSPADVCAHIKWLSALSSQHPVETIVRSAGEGKVECTILAFDYPFEFSLITGVLAGMGFHIIMGDIFTYADSPVEARRDRRRRRPRGRVVPDELKRRKIVDHFSGFVDTPFSFHSYAEELKHNMKDIIMLLEHGDETSIAKGKHMVNEMVVRRLSHLRVDVSSFLSPMEIHVDNTTGSNTRLKVISQDTPAFLYTLSNALSLQGITIKHVKIRTINNRVEDEIDIVDARGQKITDNDVVNQIKLSVLLTKQFTYFLENAPNPYAALSRFEHIVGDVVSLPAKGRWFDLLSNPYTLKNLARLLGTSDFLWEDFIRLQYEALIPLLKPHFKKKEFSEPVETLPRRLRRVLQGADTEQEQRRRLNAFKDREIFLIDLDHILNPLIDFKVLSEKLTVLAENIVNTAFMLTYENLARRFGMPKTVAGLEARYAVFGLGKLGGAALGYASDIELLLVYSDKGRTDGEEPIENTEFYELLVKNATQLIKAKREGIFQVDLRLRPHGKAGPLACSIERFCRYYGPDGEAHSYERLALVRLRTVGGDFSFGLQVERIRDEIVYGSKSISLRELRELREKQFKEKTSGQRLNAKFSPGGLVDIEYDVQILQVMYGKDIPSLRTPKIHKALRALADAGVLVPAESSQLLDAYNFLRKLINGMRMLRGSAKDLFLPPFDSDEFAHLARRLGYKTEGGLDPAHQLRMDIGTQMAVVRAFVERHFGRDSLPGPACGTVADLVISDKVPQDLYHRILSETGFKDPPRAYVNLKRLAGYDPTMKAFARLVTLAFDILSQTPDPDMALNNWERFTRSLPSPEFHYKLFLSQPMRLEILLRILSGSQFLADTLVRNPGFLDWLTVPENLHQVRKKEDLEDELWVSLNSSPSHKVWLNRIRRIRRREILRIGTRDMYLGIPVNVVTAELSTLADAIIEMTLEKCWMKLEEEKGENLGELKERFCVMALGKLGGEELNYSSDIDLIGVCSLPSGLSKEVTEEKSHWQTRIKTVMENLRSDLSKHTDQGYAYRVDLRLRPYGESGELVPSVSSMIKYYHKRASLWEIQAALKMRPVAGNIQVGSNLLEQLRPIILQTRKREMVVRCIEKMRGAGIKKSVRGTASVIDVKSGIGGLRDIEFLVQGLQLIHGPTCPEVLESNTAKALQLLCHAGILTEKRVKILTDDYFFLRKVEHYLQILEDRQIHALPEDQDQLLALAKRVLGPESDAKQFTEVLEESLKRSREAYSTYLIQGK